MIGPIEARLGTFNDEQRWIYLLQLVAINAYAAYSNVLMAATAPRGKEIFERTSHPEVGDVVLETSTIWKAARHAEDTPKQFPNLGVLLRVVDEPIMTQDALDKMHADGDYYERAGETLADIPKERVWYLQPLDGSVPEYRWTNASFIRVSTSLEQFR